MGYHTHYCGELTVDPPMTPEHLELFKQVAHGSTDVFEPLRPELDAISGYFGCVLADATAASNDTIDINGEGYMDFQDHLKQIISVFFEPLGYKVSGEFDWDGDDSSDKGTVYIKDNVIEWVGNDVSNPGPSWDRKPAPVVLTAKDWEEIYYALDFKLTSPAVAGDNKWIAHLKDIMERIGPDGKNMTTEATAQEEVS